MNKRLRDAYKELQPNELDILNKTLRKLIENPENEEYREVVSSNIHRLIIAVDAFNISKTFTPTMRNKLTDTLSLLKELHKNEAYPDVSQLELAIKLLTIYLDNIKRKGYTRKGKDKESITEQTENLTIFGDRTTKDVFQLRAIRGESSRVDWGVFKINDNGKVIKIKEFYTRDKAVAWIEHELGFKERLSELLKGEGSLFRDESKERDVNIHRLSGRDDAEKYMLSQRKTDRQMEDVESILNQSVREMVTEKKLLTSKQIKSIIEESKRENEIAELKQELLSKSDGESDLEKLLGEIASDIIIRGKRRLET